MCLLRYLPEDFEAGLAFNYYHAIDGIVHLVVLRAAEGDSLIVVRQGVHDGACGRNYGPVLTVSVLHEKHTVIIIVLHGSICVALHEAEAQSKGVGFVGDDCGGSDCGILAGDSGIVLRYDAVLLLDGAVVVVDGAVSTVKGTVVSYVDDGELEVVEGTVQKESVRRTADVVETVVPAVIDAVAEVVIPSPVMMVDIVDRQAVYAVAIVMTVVAIEVRGTAVLYEIAMAGMYPGTVVVTGTGRSGTATGTCAVATFMTSIAGTCTGTAIMTAIAGTGAVTSVMTAICGTGALSASGRIIPMGRTLPAGGISSAGRIIPA